MATCLQRLQTNKMTNGLLCSLSVFFIVVAAITAISLIASCGPGAGKGLQFSGSSPFRIPLFADLPYGENAWDDWSQAGYTFDFDIPCTLGMDPSWDHSSRQQDFVIYLGDVITANNLPIPNASMYWDQAISPTRARGIPWATVFGNHDDASFEWPSNWFSSSGIPEAQCLSPDFSVSVEDCSFRGTTRLELMQMEITKNSLSHSNSGPRELWPAVSNYILQISSFKDPKSPLVFLYFLDSGGGSYPEVISYAQVKWVPELIFWHIPSQAFKKVAPNPMSTVQKPCVGSINYEEVASQEAEWGMMDALLNRSSIKGTTMGWIGAAPTRNCGSALLATQAMAATGRGPGAPEYWK
ncbi:putative inactive purple acid phosphatase 16 [Apostasia shenzhenica]|uniref:Putative inactive purple acid phosphatase 16 n=1 Tax=Apostasia shenzhenica TaxID=1088818 RepID=A0A2I0B1U7_9ASPA|nr:putative inactive purple acid phosphatase 16 [Apostasia shenzhenica]